MTKQRVSSFSDLDLSAIQPTTSAPKSNKKELDKVSEESGFTTRHAPVDPIVTKSGQIDGRSLRRSSKTNRLTFAISPAVDSAFRKLALELTPEGQPILPFGDVLAILLEHYRRTSV